MTMLSLRLARKHAATPQIAAFEFVAAEGGELPAFDAGAHVDFHLADGCVRSYSLCNDPAERHRYCFGVLREANSRGGSIAMHALQEGDVVQVSAPQNHFPLVAGEQHVLLAGGIGVTPIWSMAQQLHREGQRFVMHYAARSRDSAAFVPELQAMPWAEHLHTHWDDGAEDQRLNLTALLAAPQPGQQLYVCGPQGLIEATRAKARALGWPDAQVHFELFGATVAPQSGDQPFTVIVASSGQRVDVAADQTPLQALLAAGVNVPMACEQGVCGTCLTRVIDGVPEHRDQYLTPDEQAANDQFTPCCSRSRTQTLTLDV